MGFDAPKVTYVPIAIATAAAEELAALRKNCARFAAAKLELGHGRMPRPSGFQRSVTMQPH